MSTNVSRPAFRLAMVQMRVAGGQARENLGRAQRDIKRAAEAGAQVILLPEALDLGWTHPSAKAEAEPVPLGKSAQFLIACAKTSAVYVCAGVVERYGSEVYNSALLINPAGELLLHHRKINELGIGQPYYALGDRLQVTKTPLGSFGVMICADAFARGQVLSRSLALMGAEVILSPCAWAVTADHDNTRAPYGKLWLDNYAPVARDFRIWIAGVSNVGWLKDGPWAGRKCIGCSLLVGPDGKQVTMGPYGADAEAILYADVAPVARPAQGGTWESLWQGEQPAHLGPISPSRGAGTSP